MYYKVDEKYAFRGWKHLPYALRCMSGERFFKRPLFLNKADFMMLLSCNGEEALDSRVLEVKQAKLLEQLVHEGILHCSDKPMGALESYQRYHVHPSRYLDSVHWSITGKCNYKCRHCLLSAPDNRHPQLPLSDCLRIIKQMQECGIRQVDITGGEPLVRGDFLEIVKALAEHGIYIRTLFTNASLLTADLLDEMEKLHQRPVLQLSFDGVGHHSWLRGVPGSEEAVIDAFKLLQGRNILFSCAMCIHKGNAQSLADTVRLLAGFGCCGLRLNTPQELGTWREYSSQYALSWQEAWEVYREYIPTYFKEGMPISLELDGFFRCKKGSTKYVVGYDHHATEKMNLSVVPYCESIKYNAYIDAEGRLLPCMGFSDTAIAAKCPSLLTGELGEASWNSFYAVVAQTTLAQMRSHNQECQTCEHFYHCCGGCMLEGTTPEGDWLPYDPHCCWFHKQIGVSAVKKVADDAIKKYITK